MANKLKGEVGFDVDGARYTLAFSINALCELEEKLGGAVVDLGTMMTGGKRFSTMRSVFWCGLTEHHPELTEKEAGKIMTAIGFNKADALIGEAFALAFPEVTPPLGKPG
jgi:hypothetical protein